MVIFHDAIRDAGYAAARNASRNNHASAWWDVIGCNSFSSRILVLAKTITECTDEQTTRKHNVATAHRMGSKSITLRYMNTIRTTVLAIPENVF